MRMPCTVQVQLVTHKLARDISLELQVVLCRTISSAAVGLQGRGLAGEEGACQGGRGLAGEEGACDGGTAQRSRAPKRGAEGSCRWGEGQGRRLGTDWFVTRVA